MSAPTAYCPMCCTTWAAWPGAMHVCTTANKTSANPVVPAEPQTAEYHDAHMDDPDEWESTGAEVIPVPAKLAALERRVSDAEWEIRELLGQIEKLERVRVAAAAVNAVDEDPDLAAALDALNE